MDDARFWRTLYVTAEDRQNNDLERGAIPSEVEVLDEQANRQYGQPFLA